MIARKAPRGEEPVSTGPGGALARAAGGPEGRDGKRKGANEATLPSASAGTARVLYEAEASLASSRSLKLFNVEQRTR
jgi:hypothetical protein